MTNHNVETCEKKKQTMTATIKATQPNQKPHKTSSYACQICGCNKGSTCYWHKQSFQMWMWWMLMLPQELK